MKITDKSIKKLIKSPVPEDVAIGIGFMIKKHKIIKNIDLQTRLNKCSFTLTTNIDFYIGRFNVFVGGHSWKYYGYKDIQVYGRRKEESTNAEIFKL